MQFIWYHHSKITRLFISVLDDQMNRFTREDENRQNDEVVIKDTKL